MKSVSKHRHNKQCVTTIIMPYNTIRVCPNISESFQIFPNLSKSYTDTPFILAFGPFLIFSSFAIICSCTQRIFYSLPTERPVHKTGQRTPYVDAFIIVFSANSSERLRLRAFIPFHYNTCFYTHTTRRLTRTPFILSDASSALSTQPVFFVCPLRSTRCSSRFSPTTPLTSATSTSTSTSATKRFSPPATSRR